MEEKEMKKDSKKQHPIFDVGGNLNRFMTGNHGDQYHQNSWKDTLIMIGIVFVGYIVYVTFFK
jgi:rhamnogalacturonyl hydrolase YesR